MSEYDGDKPDRIEHREKLDHDGETRQRAIDLFADYLGHASDLADQDLFTVTMLLWATYMAGKLQVRLMQRSLHAMRTTPVAQSGAGVVIDHAIRGGVHGSRAMSAATEGIIRWLQTWNSDYAAKIQATAMSYCERLGWSPRIVRPVKR